MNEMSRNETDAALKPRLDFSAAFKIIVKNKCCWKKKNPIVIHVKAFLVWRSVLART